MLFCECCGKINRYRKSRKNRLLCLICADDLMKNKQPELKINTLFKNYGIEIAEIMFIDLEDDENWVG